MKRTKIVATIGPASEKESTLLKMIEAGMNVARLNFSHGSYAHHAQLIRSIRAAARATGEHVGIMADLQGPRIRLGPLPASGIEVLNNSTVVLSTRVKPPIGTIPVTYRNLHKDLKRGDRLLIADGTIEVVVESLKGQEIMCRVLLGGTLKSHKGVNAPTATLRIPPMTSKDKQDLAFALSKGVDMVSLSFVMAAENVRHSRKEIRLIAGKLHKKEISATPIIVKIEKHEAVQHFDDILEEADGIMIARGDLALEVDQADVPVLQREFIERCRAVSKPVIVATQMLESMTERPRPTRAEISDVSHAVSDHTDATMLSGESAMGKFPVETVEVMAHIIRETETSRWDDVAMRPQELLKQSVGSWIGSIARLLADESKPRLIVVASASGHTVRLIAGYRPEVPIIAAVPTKEVARRLSLVWGVAPIVVGNIATLDAFIRKAIAKLITAKLVKQGDAIVVVASDPFGKEHEANVVELRKV